MNARDWPKAALEPLLSPFSNHAVKLADEICPLSLFLNLVLGRWGESNSEIQQERRDSEAQYGKDSRKADAQHNAAAGAGGVFMVIVVRKSPIADCRC